MIGLWQATSDPAPLSPRAMAAARGAEHRFAAVTLAVLLLVGGLMGTATLFVGDLVRDGAAEWVYTSAMALCMVAAVPLLVRERAGRWETFGLVLLGDLIYVVVAMCMQDPVRYATPLLLLFPAFVAAWFLGPWELGTNMVLTTVACLLALSPSYDHALGLGIQVGISAGLLNTASLGVFILRRRVQRLLAETQALSTLDPLTGLYNRRHLVDQAPLVWRQARRDGLRIAVLVLDLDHFKLLNDAHGHATGDLVLRTVAEAITAAVRPTDLVARIGGEELVVLGVIGDATEACRLGERLRRAVAGARTADGHGVTASIGIALSRPVEDEQPNNALWQMIDSADIAMYDAKRQGRDRVVTIPAPRGAPDRPGVRQPAEGAVGGLA